MILPWDKSLCYDLLFIACGHFMEIPDVCVHFQLIRPYLWYVEKRILIK